MAEKYCDLGFNKAETDKETGNTLQVSNLVSKWTGKKANFLGDSITYGHGLADPSTEAFPMLLKNLLGLSVVRNYGISGTKIAKISKDDKMAMSVRYADMDDDADLVIVMGGTNDYGHHRDRGSLTAPFGQFSDRTAETFYGALHVLFGGLISKYPIKTIVIVTPLPRTYVMNNTTQDDRTVNPDTSKNMLDYVNAIREVAEYYSLPVLDLYKNYGITPLIEESRIRYMPDCLHPNAEGHKVIANKLANFLNNNV